MDQRAVESPSDDARFLVTRTGSLDEPLQVYLGYSGSGANPASASDYTAPDKVLILAGQASRSVKLTPVADGEIEPDEGVAARITAASSSGAAGRYNFNSTLTANATIISNAAPFATDDIYFINRATRLIVAAPGILANDFDQEGTSMTARVVTSTQHGQLTLRTDGAFEYLPTANYVGLDTFTYLARDQFGATDEATVKIVVLETVNESSVDLINLVFIDYDTLGEVGMDITGTLVDSTTTASAGYRVEFDYDSTDGIETIDATLPLSSPSDFTHELDGLYAPGILGRAVRTNLGTGQFLDSSPWRLVEVKREAAGEQFAVETDNRPTAKGNDKLKNSDAIINKYVQGVIDSEVKYVTALSNLTPEQKKQRLVDRIFERLGKNVPNSGVQDTNTAALTEIEVWLSPRKRNLKLGEHINDIDVADSRYSPVRGLFGTYPGWYYLARNHTLGPTIQVKDTLIGTDKLGHFMQQGYWLYDATVRGWTFGNETLKLTQATRDEFNGWLEGTSETQVGEMPEGDSSDPDVVAWENHKKKMEQYEALAKTFYPRAKWGIFGRWSTGVISKADMNANNEGYKFYQQIYNEALNGTYKFDITNFAVPDLNEVKHKNEFDKALEKQIGAG